MVPSNRLRQITTLFSVALCACGDVDRESARPWPTELPSNPEDGSHIDPATTELQTYYEGWYHKVAIPETNEAFFFIYTVLQDQAFLYCGRQSTLQTVYQSFPVAAYSATVGHRDVRIGELSRATALRFAGAAERDGDSCTWDIDLADGAAWTETMGWMTGSEGLETSWTVGTIRARASGWVRFNGQIVRFDDAAGYCDHNWGSVFPRAWTWMQAASFPGSDAALSASGGTVPYAGQEMQAMMVGLRLDGAMTTFRSQDLDLLEWTAEKGAWSISGSRDLERISIEARCAAETMFHLLVPTDDGMQPHAWESLIGTVDVTLQRRESADAAWEMAFQGSSEQAGVELGE